MLFSATIQCMKDFLISSSSFLLRKGNILCKWSYRIVAFTDQPLLEYNYYHVLACFYYYTSSVAVTEIPVGFVWSRPAPVVARLFHTQVLYSLLCLHYLHQYYYCNIYIYIYIYGIQSWMIDWHIGRCSKLACKKTVVI